MTLSHDVGKHDTADNPPRIVEETPGWLTIVFNQRMLTVTLMGFASGLPLLLTGSLLQAWMKESGLNLATIGLFSLVGLPYTVKFLWAPLYDGISLPLGRRRGWLALIQIGLIIALVGLSFSNPTQPLSIALAALAVTFFSASQDVVIDAYRREILADTDAEQGIGASLAVNGYRLGMLLAGGGGLILADLMSFQHVYWLMASLLSLSLPITLLASEPPLINRPHTLHDAIIAPFLEYFSRPKAIAWLGFILLYKLGDVMASQLTTPFFLDLGFSKTEIGTLVKLFGFWATIFGGFIGGIWILKLGIRRALWWFGILQGVATTGFALLALTGHHLPALALAVALENFTSALGTSAYLALMARLTHRYFTATQYALLSSIMGIPRVLISAPAGFIAQVTGWAGFFLLCVIAAVPGLILLRWLDRTGSLEQTQEFLPNS